MEDDDYNSDSETASICSSTKKQGPAAATPKAKANTKIAAAVPKAKKWFTVKKKLENPSLFILFVLAACMQAQSAPSIEHNLL